MAYVGRWLESVTFVGPNPARDFGFFHVKKLSSYLGGLMFRHDALVTDLLFLFKLLKNDLMPQNEINRILKKALQCLNLNFTCYGRGKRDILQGYSLWKKSGKSGFLDIGRLRSFMIIILFILFVRICLNNFK